MQDVCNSGGKPETLEELLARRVNSILGEMILEEFGTPWAELYRGSGRLTGRLAVEPTRMSNGDAAPGWTRVGHLTQAEFDQRFEEEEAEQTAFAKGLCGQWF